MGNIMILNFLCELKEWMIENRNEVLFSPLHNCPRDWQNMPIIYLSVAEVKKEQSRHDGRALFIFLYNECLWKRNITIHISIVYLWVGQVRKYEVLLSWPITFWNYVQKWVIGILSISLTLEFLAFIELNWGEWGLFNIAQY